MPHVHRITVQLDPPKDDFPGQVTEGFYVVDGNMLTMVDGITGAPMKRDDGSIFERRLDPGATQRAITGVAAALTREVRRVKLGLTPTEDKFARRLAYPKSGVA